MSREETLRHLGYSARLAGNSVFEKVTLMVICANAAWIGVDLELNDAAVWIDALPMFQVADNMFCAYFTFEVCVRFCAFRTKLKFWKDRSFVFDVSLVVLMVAETWVFPLILVFGLGIGQSGLKQLTTLRLLRLVRLTRMARLMRSIPELMMLMKSLIKALRSVVVTFAFMLIILWVFAIIFTEQYKDAVNAGVLHEFYFTRLGTAMCALFVNGTILSEVSYLILALLDDSWIMLALFYFFILSASLTVLNMLTGVLRDVITKTGQEEVRSMAIAESRRTLKRVFMETDVDNSGKVSGIEFEAMIADKDSEVACALVELGLVEEELEEVSRHIFQTIDVDEAEANFCEDLSEGCSIQTLNSRGSKHSHAKDRELTFDEFMDEILALIPMGGDVSVRDITALRRSTISMAKAAEESIMEANIGLRAVIDKIASPPKLRKLSQVPTSMLLYELASRLEPRPDSPLFGNRPENETDR